MAVPDDDRIGQGVRQTTMALGRFLENFAGKVLRFHRAEDETSAATVRLEPNSRSSTTRTSAVQLLASALEHIHLKAAVLEHVVRQTNDSGLFQECAIRVGNFSRAATTLKE